MELTHELLKERQRSYRDDFSPALALRTHRALSWLQRAEMEVDDGDARFIFLWIAFNSAYANEINDQQVISEQKLLLRFLQRLIETDHQNLIYKIVWNEFPGAIRVLIDNRYVFGPFWDFQRGAISESEWREKFEQSKRIAHRAFGRMDTHKVLAVVFGRLYTLRNQLMHGGATWNSSVNRNQIRDGTRILDRLVPTVIHLMMEGSHQLWGDARYPVFEAD